MHIVKLDLEQGLVLIDSIRIGVDENSSLARLIEKLCSPPIHTDEDRTRYCLLNKADVCGKSADVVIEVEEGRVCTVTFLFDLLEFFESSILESNVLKACEKSLDLKFVSKHPSNAILESCKWGQAKFSYDTKQGDLSLDISFEHRSGELGVEVELVT